MLNLVRQEWNDKQLLNQKVSSDIQLYKAQTDVVHGILRQAENPADLG